MIRPPPRSTLSSSSAASDVYKRQSPRSTGTSFGEAYPSAVCYFTGRDLLEASNGTVPVGLITAAWSGSAIESWMTAGMMQDGIPPSLGGNGTCGGLLGVDSAVTTITNSTCPKEGDFGRCGGMFNGMISPLTPMRLTGILWYQGEENDHADEPCGPAYYSCLFPAMISAWRHEFGSPRLPFYYVLLAGGHTAVMRQAQVAARKLHDVEFASAMDLSATAAEEIIPGHPPRKQEVGRRLGLIAQSQIYGLDVTFRGPAVTHISASLVGSKIVANLTFDSRDSLHLNGTAACTECCSPKGSPVAFTDASPHANRTVATLYHVVGNSLIAEAEGGTFGSRVLMEFQFDNMPECAVYSRAGGGPNNHRGLVAESWSGVVLLK
eukprot:TRINITY_DN18057_c0_g1_i2.p1 TRINITY_DN18057_c0_g1~~TRINITY_DN18057_c0_g1_i2.p1  ORF type:complete len:379 (+),score=53.43 TRINITY_DN18057_c0_g1_i2:101-1237(+)